MTLEKAIEIVKLVIATKNNNEITLKDDLQFRIAITVMSKNLSMEQIVLLFN